MKTAMKDALPYFGKLRDVTNGVHPCSIIMSEKTVELIRGPSTWTAQIFNGAPVVLDNRLKYRTVRLVVNLLQD
jgi:hypothetical protein